MEKNLVILIGNARGGEQTWKTLYDNLIDVYSADLLLCFGKTNNTNNSLYKKAKYVFELEEYNNWNDYYKKFFSNKWKDSFLHGKNHGLAGGLDSYSGSGSIIFAFRHFLKNNCLNILTLYDRIILTRSDYFYLHKHTILSNDKIWIPEGEDYGGITDRCHIFPSSFAEKILGVIEYMDSNIGFNNISKTYNPNPEIILKLFFKHINIMQYIERFKRCQFTVCTKNDRTRWQKGTILVPGYEDLYIKYINEYRQTIKSGKK
jgi:hypothetical protein